MNSILRYVLVSATLLHIVPGCGAQTLQAMVDSTPPGGILSLAPGVYVGPVLIDRAITLDGGGKATVDGGGKGTVVKLRSRGATIRRLHITYSGDSHDDMDAAIVVEGDANVVEGNVLDDVLFGIVLKAAKDNRVRANYIRSRHADPADRGDALRLWYSFGNRIERNSISDARDIALANSGGNRIIGNTVRNSRTGLHMIFAKRTLIEGNTFSHNSGGIFCHQLGRNYPTRQSH